MTRLLLSACALILEELRIVVGKVDRCAMTQLQSLSLRSHFGSVVGTKIRKHDINEYKSKDKLGLCGDSLISISPNVIVS